MALQIRPIELSLSRFIIDIKLIYRGSCGGVPREQVPQHPSTWKGVWRARHSLQLQEDCYHQR